MKAWGEFSQADSFHDIKPLSGQAKRNAFAFWDILFSDNETLAEASWNDLTWEEIAVLIYGRYEWEFVFETPDIPPIK